MSMFNDISCGTKGNKEECLANAQVVSLYGRKFGTGLRGNVLNCTGSHVHRDSQSYNLFLTIERGDPLKRQDQTIHRIKVYLGLLKCGKVEMENAIDQGNLMW